MFETSLAVARDRPSRRRRTLRAVFASFDDDGAAHASSWSTWARVARTRLEASSSSAALIATRGVGRLVGIDADVHLHGPSVVAGGWNRGGHSCFEFGASPLASHAAAKPRPSRPSFDSQTPTLRAGRHFVSYLNRDLSDATNRPQHPPAVSRGSSGASGIDRLRSRR